MPDDAPDDHLRRYIKARREGGHRRAIRRSVVIKGRKVGVCLQQEFWSGLSYIAHQRRISLSQLLEVIGEKRSTDTMASAARLFVLDYFRTMAEANRAMAEANWINDSRVCSCRLN